MCVVHESRRLERGRAREKESILSKQLGKNCRDRTYAQSVILEKTERSEEGENEKRNVVVAVVVLPPQKFYYQMKKSRLSEFGVNFDT